MISGAIQSELARGASFPNARVGATPRRNGCVIYISGVTDADHEIIGAVVGKVADSHRRVNIELVFD